MRDAFYEIADMLDDLDRSRMTLRLPSLSEADATWKQRIDGVMSCLDMAFYERDLHEPPNLEDIAKAGAHLVAMYEAAVRAQETRVETGDAT